jgi:HAD superfamily hydrolase (TIGR01509 family)
MVRSVIFDLGGTLVDFHSGAADWRGMEARGIAAFRRFLAGRGCAPPESEFNASVWDALDVGWQAALAGQANMRLLDMVAATAAHFGMVLDDQAQMQATRVYAAAVAQGSVPCHGVHETLSTLKERGLRLGLLSNTMWPGHLHRQDLERFGLAEFLDVMVFSSDVGLWKPNAAAFRYVMDRLGVSPAESVFVGDLPEIDVAGSQRAGLRAIWIATDGIEQGNVRPDAMIHRLTELPGVLDCLP